VVGMLGSDMETSRDILKSCREDAGGGQEVGVAHSSEEASVMERGAKGPYLVDVDREAKDVRWLENRY
jgi:hypothetical protein